MPSWRDGLPDATAWVAAAYPHEGCGLIVRCGERYRFVACANRVDGPAAQTRYELDPLEFVRAEDRGEQVVAIVHSHVDASDDFSHVDRAAALMPDLEPAYPGVDYLVVAVRRATAEHASLFRFDAHRAEFSRVWSEPVA